MCDPDDGCCAKLASIPFVRGGRYSIALACRPFFSARVTYGPFASHVALEPNGGFPGIVEAAGGCKRANPLRTGVRWHGMPRQRLLSLHLLKRLAL